MSIASELLVILCLIAANGLFAGAEIAILAVRRTRLRELVEEGRESARVIQRIREDPESFFATVQIGITVVSATAAAFGGARVARALTPLLEHAVRAPYAEDLALAIVIGAIAYFSIVFGELIPKSLALRAAERYGLLVARPLFALSRAARPLVWLLTGTSNVILKGFRDRTTFTESRLSKEELQQLVDESANAGDIDAKSGEIAYRALDFGDVRVGAIMIPRPEMITVAHDAPRERIRELLQRHGFSRVPVHRQTPEEIVGYVTARDLLALAVGDDARSVSDVSREALFVPESRLAADVLRDMQRTRDHLALVVDAHGGVAGLVTLEDLLEELVGEIFAEHETPIERICHEPDGGVLVKGRVPVHEINRELGLELPESDAWSTMGGLATALAGRIPVAGTTLVAGHGVTLEIVDMSERRVQRVRIRASKGPRRRPSQA